MSVSSHLRLQFEYRQCRSNKLRRVPGTYELFYAEQSNKTLLEAIQSDLDREIEKEKEKKKLEEIKKQNSRQLIRPIPECHKETVEESSLPKKKGKKTETET